MKLQCLYADGFLPACGVDASGAAGIQTLREKGWLLVLIEIASLEYLSREAPPDKYDGQRLLRSASQGFACSLPYTGDFKQSF